jgi:hypothetical protein
VCERERRRRRRAEDGERERERERKGQTTNRVVDLAPFALRRVETSKVIE